MNQSKTVGDVIPVVIGNYYNAYGIVRSFAQEGLRSVLVAGKTRNFLQSSKYLEDCVAAEDPAENAEGFVRDLIALGERLAPRRGMLFPTHDEQVVAIADHTKELEPYYEIPFSERTVCRQIMDKDAYARTAEQLGLPTIRGKLANSAAEAMALLDRYGLPVLIKSNTADEHMVHLMGNRTQAFEDRTSYESYVDRYFSLCPEGSVLVQEYIADSDRKMITINCVTDRNGNALCVSAEEKIRQYPPQSGTSTVMRGADPRQEPYRTVAEYTTRLLKHCGYYGLSGTEYKYDPRDGMYKIIETNIRSEFPNYIQTMAGQNMPYQLYRYHLGMEVTLPFYPDRPLATCFVPFNDWYYSCCYNRLAYPAFHITGRERKKTIPAPKTGYGLTLRDPKPWISAYRQAIWAGINGYIRLRLGIPPYIRTVDYLLKRKRS